MKLAAIDIGSNAIRLQIVRVMEKNKDIQIKKQEFIRFPLRLGKDVFKYGKIRFNTEDKFVKLMTAFKTFLDLYDVDEYLACATSAMREAENGEEIAQRVYYDCGLKINVIGGDREAELINQAIYRFLGDGNYIHIDVGGGSTELNIYKDKEKIASKSFRMGSVRNPSDEELKVIFEKAATWLESKTSKLEGEITTIGTGGNINKILDVSGEKTKKELSLEKVQETRDYIATFSYEDRLSVLKLNSDRADVIIPASYIYIKIMELVDSNRILIPNVGLKDGIISHLYRQYGNQ